MYVPFQRMKSTATPAICGESAAFASKTHGHRQNLHASKTQSLQADHRTNSAIHRVCNANEAHRPQASLLTSDATHHNPRYPAGKRQLCVYAGGFSWLRRVSQVTVLF